MSGVVGVVGRRQVNQLIYDSLLLLQHRGQDAAGIVTMQDDKFNEHKGYGLVRDVFRTRNMRLLHGKAGIGHTNYQTEGSDNSVDEPQPFYVNAPFGITLGHNGNLTNWRELRESLFRVDKRHINSDSDSEVLLNVLAHELHTATAGIGLDESSIFSAVQALHARANGSYSVVAMIAGYGLLAFRDPYGIRPLCLGRRDEGSGEEWMVASESVALAGSGFTFVRDVLPGEAVFIDLDGNISSRAYGGRETHAPCVFEYVYFARPDSARPAAMQLATQLNLNYREGLNKNRYVGRTFIMPGQELRRKSVRQKLTTIDSEFRGKNVLLVDDSIVRGTTSREIVAMARAAGARKVYMASAAPPVRHSNVYGIDMPTQAELIAYDRSEDEVARCIDVDALIYQDLEALRASVTSINPAITEFEDSCFSGRYVTGDIKAT